MEYLRIGNGFVIHMKTRKVVKEKSVDPELVSDGSPEVRQAFGLTEKVESKKHSLPVKVEGSGSGKATLTVKTPYDTIEITRDHATDDDLSYFGQRLNTQQGRRVARIVDGEMILTGAFDEAMIRYEPDYDKMTGVEMDQYVQEKPRGWSGWTVAQKRKWLKES